MKKSILRTQDVSKNFIQGNELILVLNNINALFTQEKTYAITGISGSGKSTFMHILAGLETPSSGHVFFNDEIVHSFSHTQRAPFLNQSIGLVFQASYLLKELSVIENIMLPGLIKGTKKNTCQERAELLLKKIGLLDKKQSMPGELSGGQQQRVAIARALFNEPAFLIADEPTGNLDKETGKKIIDLLISCHQEWDMGIIISSHDDYVVKQMDTVYTLDKGILI